MNAPGFETVDFSKVALLFRRRHRRAGTLSRRSGRKRPDAPSRRAMAFRKRRPSSRPTAADFEEFSGTIGAPIPSTEIIILKADDTPGGLRGAGRNLRARPAGDARLLEQAGGNRKGDDRGRVLPHRRYRRDAGKRADQDCRSAEGHDPRLWLQRLSERGRGGDRLPPRRAGSRGRRQG